MCKNDEMHTLNRWIDCERGEEERCREGKTTESTKKKMRNEGRTKKKGENRWRAAITQVRSSECKVPSSELLEIRTH